MSGSKKMCKYKLLDKEKFNGKPYCTLFNEVCESISFVCDKNCQVYEDYKELEKLKEQLSEPLYIKKAKFLRELTAKQTQLKNVLKDIRAMIDFECQCGAEHMCICQVCDKYDAIINKIDGVLNNVEHN